MVNFQLLEKYRVKSGAGASNPHDPFGVFFIPTKQASVVPMKVAVDPYNGEDWHHICVSLPSRPPTFVEIERVKEMVWGTDVEMIQFYTAKNRLINGPYKIHLFIKVNGEAEKPPFPWN